VGADSAQLADAIERLALYVSPETRIGIEAVDAVILASRRRSIFDLMKIVGQGSIEGALACVAALDPDDRAPLKIVFMLSRHIRQLAIAKSLAARKLDRFEIARVAGVPPFVAGELIEQARGFSAEALERAFASLAGADLLIKSSRNDDHILLDRLLLQLCSLKGSSSKAGPRTPPRSGGSATSSRARG
jgi:DNA polymerase-3 subunit delta